MLLHSKLTAMIANTTVRIAYFRYYGFINQPYYWQHEEDEANRTDTDVPLWGSLTAFTNYMVDFLRKRGLTTVLVRAAESLKVGTSNANGTYDGLVGLLQNDKADFSSFPIALDLPFDPIEYTDYFAETKTAFLESMPLNKDNGESIDFFIQLTGVYSRDIWILFLNAISIVVLFLYFSHRLKRIYVKKSINIKSALRNMFNLLWQLIRVPVNQPDIQFRKPTARFIALIFLVVIFFSNIMALNLVGTKMVVRSESIVKSFEELLTKPEYSVHWLSNSYLLPQFQSAIDPNSIHAKLFKLFSIKPNAVFQLKTGYSIIEMLQGSFASPNTLLIDEEFGICVTSLHICKLVTGTVKLRKTVVEGLNKRFAYGYNKRINPLLKKWLHQARKRTFEAGFTRQMPELGLLFDPETAAIIHCIEKMQETDEGLRPIKMNDIIVLTRIAAIVFAIAFVCLNLELIHRHVKAKSIRRLIRKIKFYSRVSKLRVRDRILFGFRTRYNRRTIRVNPIR